MSIPPNESETTNIKFRTPATIEDDHWLFELWRGEWGGETVVSRGRIHRLPDLKALIAFRGNVRVGAVTYRIEDDDCELVSLNALIPGQGVGTILLKSVDFVARGSGCRRIWLITTNDNLDGLRFYQRRGYRLSRLYPNAIEESRRLKPSIPLVGANGIPIRDELELEMTLEAEPLHLAGK